MILDLPQGALIHSKPNEIGKDDGRLDILSEWLIEHKSLFQSKRVLDIGSNCGHFPFLYSDLGASWVIGVEGRKEFIETYNVIKAEHYGENCITMIHSDLRDVDYSRIGPVDVLSTIGIIYHVENIKEHLRKIISITKPSVWIVESQLWNLTHIVDEGGSGSDATQAIKEEAVLRPNAATVESIIRQLGFNCIRFQVSELYKVNSTSKDPRGFWLCFNESES